MSSFFNNILDIYFTFKKEIILKMAEYIKDKKNIILKKHVFTYITFTMEVSSILNKINNFEHSLQ